jgi:hypothetical protein
MFPEMGISLGLKEVIEVNLNHIWKYGVLKKASASATVSQATHTPSFPHPSSRLSMKESLNC